ncbi:hypothetical protein DVH05_012441 [Phytophthora capsici]|nr:hypothetical protein DVH05_012441 [Phytophthora capsici]
MAFLADEDASVFQAALDFVDEYALECHGDVFSLTETPEQGLGGPSSHSLVQWFRSTSQTSGGRLPIRGCFCHQVRKLEGNRSPRSYQPTQIGLEMRLNTSWHSSTGKWRNSNNN